WTEVGDGGYSRCMRAGRWFAPDLLRGEVAIVTGGGTGIGKAISIALADCGASVVIASRQQAHLDAGKREIAAATGVEPLAIACDIREPDAVDSLVATVAEHLGRIDLLVNNAGGQFAQRAEDFSVRGWRAVIDNNLNV